MDKIKVYASEVIQNPELYKICRNCKATNLKSNYKCHNCEYECHQYFYDQPEQVKKMVEEEHPLHDYGCDGDFVLVVGEV